MKFISEFRYLKNWASGLTLKLSEAGQNVWELLGGFFVVLAMFGAGTASIFQRILIENTSPLVIVFGMFIVAACGALLICLLSKRKVLVRPKLLAWFTLIAFFGILGNLAMVEAISAIAPTIALTVARTEIFMAILMSMVLLGERPSLILWLGVFLAMVGVTLVKPPAWPMQVESYAPLLWSVLCAFSFACLQIISKYIIKSIDPWVMNFWRLFLGVIVLSVYGDSMSQLMALNQTQLFYIALSGLAAPLGARIFYTYALKWVEVSKAVLLTTTLPMFTLIMEVVVLNHWLNWHEALGCLLILCGVALPVYQNMKQKRCVKA